MKSNFDKSVKAVKRNITPLSYSIVAFFLFFLIFDYLITAQAESAQSKKRIEASNYASILKSKVDYELNSLLFISSGLSSYLTVYHKNIEPDKVQAILADLYSRSKHVRNLAVAVNYRITYVYPIETNQQIIGVDYRDLPKQWPLVQKAVEMRQGVLVGPIGLLQGGRGLIYRYPIYIDNQYWGLLSTVIDTNQFLAAAFNNTSDQYEFAIRARDFSGRVDKAFYGNDQLFTDDRAYQTVSEVPNAKWEWAILDKTQKEYQYLTVMRLVIIGLSTLLAYIVFFFLKERTTLSSHARYDSLTGLANRRMLYIKMDQALLQSRRFEQIFGVMFIDIDYFKNINDTHGHDFGDELLKTVAEKLLGCIRHVDTLSRIGGDEFVVVIEQLVNKADINVIANKILASFSEPINILGIDILIGLSIGISIYAPDKPNTIKGLMKEADIALYDVKANGRNSYKVFATE